MARCVLILDLPPGGGYRFLPLSTTFCCGYADFQGAKMTLLPRFYALFGHIPGEIPALAGMPMEVASRCDWGLGASFLDYALFGGNSTQRGLALFLGRSVGLVLAEMDLDA